MDVTEIKSVAIGTAITLPPNQSRDQAVADLKSPPIFTLFFFIIIFVT